MSVRSRIRDVFDPDYGLPVRAMSVSPEQRTEKAGESLVVIFALEELGHKLARVLETVERIEAKLNAGTGHSD